MYARICVSLCSPRWLQRFSILWFTDEVRSTVSKCHANAQSHLDIETPTPTLLQLRGNRVSCSCHCLAFCTSPNNSSETKNATVMWVDQLADTLHCLGRGKLISNSNINYLFATLAKQNYRNAKQYDIDTNKQHVESNIDIINIYQVLHIFFKLHCNSFEHLLHVQGIIKSHLRSRSFRCFVFYICHTHKVTFFSWPFALWLLWHRFCEPIWTQSSPVRSGPTLDCLAIDYCVPWPLWVIFHTIHVQYPCTCTCRQKHGCKS